MKDKCVLIKPPWERRFISFLNTIIPVIGYKEKSNDTTDRGFQHRQATQSV